MDQGGETKPGTLRILVGDDDRVNRLVVRGMLKTLGQDCWVVGTGREVVEAVAREPFDLILLDVQFPDINGFEAVRQIQQHLRQSHLPRIAFLSGHDACDFREDLAELGIHDFLSKPITIEALKGVVS